MRLKSILSLLLIALLLLAGCAVQSQLNRSELKPGYQAEPLKRVMVVGWFEDRTNRIKFENEFVHQFRQHGATAVTSLAVLSKAKEYDKAEIMRQAKLQKVQAIFAGYLLVMDAADKSTPTYNQDFYSIAPGINPSSRVPTSYSQVQHKIRIITQLFDLKNKKPYWSAETQIEKAETVGDVLQNLAITVMGDLKAKGLVR
ncbi:MAG: hypothetical protein KQH53_07580 [Desulfarculaceae bacterium]|nr:hypothetical protein [Desulfarculaceae bacterium]